MMIYIINEVEYFGENEPTKSNIIRCYLSKKKAEEFVNNYMKNAEVGFSCEIITSELIEEA